MDTNLLHSGTCPVCGEVLPPSFQEWDECPSCGAAFYDLD